MGKSSKSANRAGGRPRARVLKQIALLPEIAFARVGSSTEPLDSYDWTEPDNSPAGSGKTGLESKLTLRVSDAGEIREFVSESDKKHRKAKKTIQSRMEIPQRPHKRPPVQFTEAVHDGREQRFRPVCPWFVIFAKWSDSDDWQVLSPRDLEAIGVRPTDVSWHIVVANRKAYNMTMAFEDIVYAETSVGGADYDIYRGKQPKLIEKRLIGRSSKDYWEKYSEFRTHKIDFKDSERLIPRNEQQFELGCIQAPAFSEPYGIRLRVVPPPGAVYGPANLKKRIEELSRELSEEERANAFDEWLKLDILKEDRRQRYCILNPNSAWARKRTKTDQEVRTEPGPQYAHIEVKKDGRYQGYNSLGLIDDFSDGVITVELKTRNGTHKAKARIVTGPPDLAPDRRHPVRFYETFEDRIYLGGGKGYDGQPQHLTDAQLRDEVLDTFRRAYETVGLTNVDAQNHRFATDTPYGSEFSKQIPGTAPGDLPLTQWARERHRRLATLETLEDFLREQPERTGVRRVILEPGDENDKCGLLNLPPKDDTGEVPAANSFTRMPALMRGSNVAPLHLTKRQIEVLRRWIEKLR